MAPPRSVPLEAADHWIIDRSSSASFPWSTSWYLTSSAEHATTTPAVPSCESLSETLGAFLRMFTIHGLRFASVGDSPFRHHLGFVCLWIVQVVHIDEWASEYFGEGAPNVDFLLPDTPCCVVQVSRFFFSLPSDELAGQLGVPDVSNPYHNYDQHMSVNGGRGR